MPNPQPEHPNAVAYRQAAAAFRAGDLTAIEALLDVNVLWHVPGTHQLAGDVIGRDAVAAFLTRLGQLGFWLVEHDVFGNDAHVCALSEMGATRAGTTVSTGRQHLPLSGRTAGRKMVLPRRHDGLELHLPSDVAPAPWGGHQH